MLQRDKELQWDLAESREKMGHGGYAHKLTVTLMPWPAERVSRGWISEGISQPRGPQDQAKAAMKTQMRTMTPMATECGSSVVLLPKYTPEAAKCQEGHE